MTPDLTALIRTYNSGQTLEACLESLSEQTHPIERIVVVDSGSTDDTRVIAAEYGADIVEYPDEEFNYSRALNIGMGHVDTEYTLIISSHVALPDSETLRVLLKLLREDDRCAASIRGMAGSEDEAKIGSVEWESVTAENFVSRFGGIAISNSCNLIPTALWRENQFDEEIPRCEDQDWLLYFLERGWTAAHVRRPQIVYDNPHYNDTKEIQDLVTLAKYDINSTLTNTESLAQRLRGAARALRHLDLSEFLYETRLVYELLLVRLGLHEDSPSRYF